MFEEWTILVKLLGQHDLIKYGLNQVFIRFTQMILALDIDEMLNCGFFFSNIETNRACFKQYVDRYYHAIQLCMHN
jgi:hypothetical protein